MAPSSSKEWSLHGSQYGSPVATTYNAADRISSTGYAYDADGNLTTQPGQNLEWDSLGRLKDVKNSSTWS